MADNSRISEVPYACEVSLCHLNGNGKEFIQDCHRVWYVYDLFITRNLGNEITRIRKIRRDGHSDTQCAHVLIVMKQIFNLSNNKQYGIITRITVMWFQHVCHKIMLTNDLKPKGTPKALYFISKQKAKDFCHRPGRVLRRTTMADRILTLDK